MFEKTSTEDAPWTVIAANYKWYARVRVLKTVVETLERANLKQEGLRCNSPAVRSRAARGRARSCSCGMRPAFRQRQQGEHGRRRTKKPRPGITRGAVALYESALDGTPKTAEVHYKLALLYDEKLKSPIDALHHMDRYLELAPTGAARAATPRPKEGRRRRKLLTKLAKGSPITQQDAVRFKNENEILREQLTALRAQKALPAATVNAKGEPVQKPIPPGARTYTVESGDTLAKISQALLQEHRPRARHPGREFQFPRRHGEDQARHGADHPVRFWRATGCGGLGLE